MPSYEVSPLTRISRDPHRGSYDKEVIYAILDEAIDITVSYIADEVPRAIPTGFVRLEDRLYIHGSVKSHFIRQICASKKVCLTVSLLDGLVLANTAFNHSFNYRSVIAFSSPFEVEDEQLKMEVLKAFTEKLLPGRWEDDIKLPTPEELMVTSVVCFQLEEASAKMRQGQPNNVKSEGQRRAWTGYIPLIRNWGMPVASPDMGAHAPLPEYIREFTGK
ncbi:MAG: pyridoxamine 5'-phosphate oxidase family protein [Hymenobacteraceae bacterium]|nr:pyridoxamine 5'-phosphate oxidase family protein [Hymenobacteraceae bacterium]MDX5481170.1 pyridoxamine 5'-phosphate oxidase family protein [Hymenobacteraceae bacterium]